MSIYEILQWAYNTVGLLGFDAVVVVNVTLNAFLGKISVSVRKIHLNAILF